MAEQDEASRVSVAGESVAELDVSSITEDEAVRLMGALSERFGWSGTFFQRADVATAWEREVESYVGFPSAFMPDEVWHQVWGSYEWRRLPDRLCEQGWEHVDGAVAEWLREFFDKGGQFIYFDESDDSADGCGWNVVDNGSIAARFTTRDEAVGFCESEGWPYIEVQS